MQRQDQGLNLGRSPSHLALLPKQQLEEATLPLGRQLRALVCSNLGRLGVRAEQPPGLQQLGSDRRLSREVPPSVLAINKCPEASPCFFAHHLCSVTVEKDLEAPHCSNNSFFCCLLLFKAQCIPCMVLIRRKK
jgi:hypothetical protein